MKELTLKELQDFELDILKDVHTFCVKNGIKYSLCGGTLIGAIRHQGYIPWDDDIDIMMPRPDYEKFFQYYKSSKYVAVNNSVDKKCFTAFGRVCDKEKTVAVSRIPWCTSNNYGVFIDVFPADGFPEKEIEQSAAYLKNHKLLNDIVDRRRALSKFDKNISIKANLMLAIRKLRYLFGVRTSYYTQKLVKENKTIKFGETDLWATISHVVNPKTKKHFPISTFDHCDLYRFEDAEFFVMCGYDEVLRSSYGDYMQLPPEEKRIPLMQSYIHFFWK